MSRQYYLEDLPLDEAQQRFDAALARVGADARLSAEQVPLAAALHRVTAGPVWARLSSPHYHAAAMDGIAVRAAETVGATDTAPLRLRVGAQALWVDTGDPLPPDTDAVIMVEQVQTIGEDAVEIRAAVAPWQHVRPLGEDIVATELLLPEHHRLRPVDLGVLAAAGHTEVAVYRRPRVAIIPTGTELVTLPTTDQRPTTNDQQQKPRTENQEPIQANPKVRPLTPSPAPGQIIEFNSLMLAGQVTEWDGEPMRRAPVPDRRELLRAAIELALNDADVVVVNAGSSAGSEDYTAAIIAELGEVVVHGVAIRPGHPVILGVARGKPLLGLPGYPISAMLTSELFLRPLLYRLQAQTPPRRPTTPAIISRKLLSPLGEDEFVRVALGQVDERIVATPLARGAGVVSSLARADGIVQIPRFSEGLHAGAQVTAELLRDPQAISATIVAIGSHDLALDLLSTQMRAFRSDVRLVSANVGSMGGLLALKRGDAHLAGSHLLDEETGTYNWPMITRLLPEEDIVLVTLVGRMQGLILPSGNPHQLHDLADLTREGLQFVNRQKGSGTRVLLDYHLKQQRINADQIATYGREEFTHMAVAAAVMSGKADVGLGILAAARALELDFVPLFDERYDLVVPRRHWESALLQPLRQALASPEYRTAVHALGGYDTSVMGNVVPQP